MASDSFQWLSDGYDQHSPAPGEETLTDVHIRHLRQAMGHRIKVIQFTKPQESRNGADWELWIHNRFHGVGLRLQAKRADARRQYGVDHWLHRQNAYQCDLLINHAPLVGCVPVYLLYNHTTWDVDPAAEKWLCGHTVPDGSHHGCSLVSAYQVQSQLFNLATGVRRNLDHVGLRASSLPWNRVLCDERVPIAADPRGTAALTEMLTAVHALDKSGRAALPSVPPCPTPSHAWSEHPEFELARPLFADHSDETAPKAPMRLKPLPAHVQVLLTMPSDERPRALDVPTRGVVLYDVTGVDEPLFPDSEEVRMHWQ
jgi:hypothetical protein